MQKLSSKYNFSSKLVMIAYIPKNLSATLPKTNKIYRFETQTNPRLEKAVPKLDPNPSFDTSPLSYILYYILTAVEGFFINNLLRKVNNFCFLYKYECQNHILIKYYVKIMFCFLQLNYMVYGYFWYYCCFLKRNSQCWKALHFFFQKYERFLI